MAVKAVLWTVFGIRIRPELVLELNGSVVSLNGSVVSLNGSRVRLRGFGVSFVAPSF